MANGRWSFGCRADVENYGYPGWGAYYRIYRNGVAGPAYGVSGGVYQKFASVGYECHVQPFLGAPVKDYGWVAEMNYGRGCWGQWFENGAIGYHDGAWQIMYGRYGQSAFRAARALRHPLRRLGQIRTAHPPDAPTPHPPGEDGPPEHGTG